MILSGWCATQVSSSSRDQHPPPAAVDTVSIQYSHIRGTETKKLRISEMIYRVLLAFMQFEPFGIIWRVCLVSWYAGCGDSHQHAAAYSYLKCRPGTVLGPREKRLGKTPRAYHEMSFSSKVRKWCLRATCGRTNGSRLTGVHRDWVYLDPRYEGYLSISLVDKISTPIRHPLLTWAIITIQNRGLVELEVIDLGKSEDIGRLTFVYPSWPSG